MRRFAAQGPGGAASPQGLMAVTDRQGGTREPPRHYAWSSYAGLTRALCADKFAHFDTKKFGAHDVAAQRLIPLASTCPVASRCLMRHVSLHPSSFALLLWLRPRSSARRHMQPQNHSRPAPSSRRKTSRRAMGEEGGESFDHLVAKICKPAQNRNNRNNFRKFCFRTNPLSLLKNELRTIWWGISRRVSPCQSHAARRS
jgi:hypothetical protein